jgi:hypothetical protein
MMLLAYVVNWLPAQRFRHLDPKAGPRELPTYPQVQYCRSTRAGAPSVTVRTDVWHVEACRDGIVGGAYVHSVISVTL